MEAPDPVYKSPASLVAAVLPPLTLDEPLLSVKSQLQKSTAWALSH